MEDDPKIAALKAIVASSHGITGYATLAILAGIILELVILFIFAHEISRWEKAALVLANVLIAAGLAAEYWYGGKGATAAAELQQISDASIAKANADAANARLEQERLKKSVVWRQISPSDCRHFGNLIRGGGSQKKALLIEYPFGDPEALSFTISIANCFGQYGWIVQTHALGFTTALPIGLIITGPPEDRYHDTYQNVKAAFKNARFASDWDDRGIEARVGHRYNGPAGPWDVKIIVGSRPVK